tara:strand:- start:119 stop:1123 length:1005 start_codon:yes stop_codon:yes gene_type:complete
MSKAAELAKWGEVSTNGQVSGRRNIIINGAMNVAQRGAATSAGALGDAVEMGNIDRFKIEAGNTAGRFTMEQTAITDLPGFANCMELTCTTADTTIAAGEFITLSQYLEGQDLQQMKKGTSSAEAVTVSFYVKGNASATHTLELRDNDNSRFNSQEFPVTTDWVRVSRTFVGDTTGAFDDDNALSLKCNIHLHAGSDMAGGTHVSNTWGTTTNTRVGDNQTSFVDADTRNLFITGLQMEVGSVATPFEHRSFGEELQLAKRYYEVIDRVYPALYSGSTTLNNFYFVEKRATPALSADTNSGGHALNANGTNSGYIYKSGGNSNAVTTLRLDIEL